MLTATDAGSGTEQDRRLTVLAALWAAAFLVLAARLFHLQIIEGAEMYRLAEENRTQVLSLAAPRGRILDRNGEVLLDNAPKFSVFDSNLSVSASDSRTVEEELTALFPDKEALVRKHLGEARRTGKMTRILAGVPREKALGLIERRVTLPGVQVVVEPQRRARAGTLACHVIGYVDEITPQDLKSSQDERFKAGQFVGRMGVERMYDPLLRGTDGGLQFEMDARGRHLKVLRRSPGIPGNDVVLTLDRSLQEAAERGLALTETGRGAVVALDPRTGFVLALASHPGFDPTGDMAPLLEDPELPLFNRALQGTYPPGSTFKSVTALAALKGGWDMDRVIKCAGVFRLGRKEFKCWKKHGSMDFMGAMAWSCDVYHYNMGLAAGVNALEEMGRSFGLGEAAGIDLSSEASGVLPGRAWKRATQHDAWYDGDTVNMSIGQGFVLVTPLQAALVMAALANGGTVWRPQVVERVVSPEGKELYKAAPQVHRIVTLTPELWGTIQESLQEVVLRGTGRGVNRPDLVIGAKTGTAQNPHGEDHAWFTTYAGRPGEPSSIAIVGFVENGGHGAEAAMPIVREVLKKAFPLPEKKI
jgi:penicillin-binding protein 2